jgi:ribosomal protein S18 acetylase RimI-like enzyme
VSRGALQRDSVAGPVIGYWNAGALEGVCILGSNLVISDPASDSAIDAFGDYARREGILFWVAVGPDKTMARFLETYGRDTRRIHLERGDQGLYQLTSEELHEGPRCAALRLAQVEDLEALVGLDRRMVTEEIGFDPFARVLEAYRQGWLRRIREGRAWVIGPVGGPLSFKVDQSAASEQAVQLAGIYTVPERRAQGIATAATGEMCHRLLARVPRVTLYVHRENTTAVGLYESLGFKSLGSVRSVWFEV